MPSGDWALWLCFSTICSIGLTTQPNSNVVVSTPNEQQSLLVVPMWLQCIGTTAAEHCVWAGRRRIPHPTRPHPSSYPLGVTGPIGFSALWLYVATNCLIGRVKWPNNDVVNSDILLVPCCALLFLLRDAPIAFSPTAEQNSTQTLEQL